MQRQTTFGRWFTAVCALSFAAFAAPSAVAQSVKGSYQYDYVALYVPARDTITVDAQIVDGVATGSVVVQTRYGGRLRTRYSRRYEVVSLEVVGNEAWVQVITEGGPWILHIVDNGPHGDLVGGYEIDGDFRVRES